MTRLVGTLVILVLLAPVAMAAPDAATHEALPQPALPDLRPAADAVASAGAAAASATGAALSSAAGALASLASAAGAALAALGGALLALGKALGAAIASAGRALAALAGLVGHALGALGGILAALGLSAARTMAAHPKESAIAAGSLTGASLAAWAAKKWWLSLFLPLYSRLARSEMLDNKVRASVFDHVKANPGAHPSAIAQHIGIGWGTVVYHLARLEESSLVTTRMAHNRKCYFAVGGELDNAGRSAVAAMATDKGRAIVDALRAEPGLSQKALAERLGMSQALASWHVKRLIQSGVLVATRDGRSNLLHVAEHVPVLAAGAVPSALAA